MSGLLVFEMRLMTDDTGDTVTKIVDASMGGGWTETSRSGRQDVSSVDSRGFDGPGSMRIPGSLALERRSVCSNQSDLRFRIDHHHTR
jgi:hypothetical protein